jgi:hypothetical protein
VPSIGSLSAAPFMSPKYVFQLNSSTLYIMSSRIAAGAQQITEIIIFTPKSSLVGSGITYILFVEPLRMGEYGPTLVEQVRLHVAFPYGKSLVERETGFPVSS